MRSVGPFPHASSHNIITQNSWTNVLCSILVHFIARDFEKEVKPNILGRFANKIFMLLKPMLYTHLAKDCHVIVAF